MRLKESWHASLDVFCIDAYFDGELAFALSVDDGVFAWNVDYEEPELIWETQLDVLSGANERHWLPLQSHIVVVEEPARDTVITAYEPQTGRVDWRRNFNARFGTVVGASYRLFVFCEGLCEIVDLRDGSMIQEVAIEPFCTRGFRVGNRVFAASENQLVQISIPQDSKAAVTAREEARTRGLYVSREGLVSLDGDDTLRGRVHEATRWWEFEAPPRTLELDGSTFEEPAELGFPILDDSQGDALVCDLNASLHCVDLMLGTHLWTFDGKNAPTASVAATPCIVQNLVVFPCSDESIYLIEHDSGISVSSVELQSAVEGRLFSLDSTVIVPLDGLRAFEIVDDQVE